MACLEGAVHCCSDFLLQENINVYDCASLYSRGVAELPLWRFDSGLGDLWDERNGLPNPIGALSAGDARVCTDNRRAEAIMSALGVTDWYNRTLNEAKVDAAGPLVMNTYPLAFVKEVFRRWLGISSAPSAREHRRKV